MCTDFKKRAGQEKVVPASVVIIPCTQQSAHRENVHRTTHIQQGLIFKSGSNNLQQTAKESRTLSYKLPSLNIACPLCHSYIQEFFNLKNTK